MIISEAVALAEPLLERLQGRLLTRALRVSPVVVLTGARQTGKSTLVRMADVARDRRYLTLDDRGILEQAEGAPDALLRRAPRVTLDEVQRSPDLLLAIKRVVDERRTAGRFLLTGSANLLLVRRVSETLAGRAVYLTLWPMTRREQLGLGRAGLWGELFDAKDADWLDVLAADETLAAEPWQHAALRGGYPTPAHELEDQEDRALWFAGYTQTYLERDLQELSAIENLTDFRRLMAAACLRIGNLVNQTELGRDVGLPQATVHRYLNLLETSYQLVRLPAYSVNRTKRLIKAPKLYWSDVGLALHLSGESHPRGAHLENLVLTDLLAWRDSHVDAPAVLYWRTASGEEVDFVVEWRKSLLPVEVKATVRPTLGDARHLDSFRREYGRAARAGLLVYAGDETYWLTDGVLAVPWWRVI